MLTRPPRLVQIRPDQAKTGHQCTSVPPAAAAAHGLAQACLGWSPPLPWPKR